MKYQEEISVLRRLYRDLLALIRKLDELTDSDVCNLGTMRMLSKSARQYCNKILKDVEKLLHSTSSVNPFKKVLNMAKSAVSKILETFTSLGLLEIS